MPLGNTVGPQRRRGRSLAFAALIAVVGCGASTVAAGSATITDDYVTGNGFFSDGGIVEFRVAKVNDNGRLAFCGAWQARRLSILALISLRQAVETGQLQLDGRTALRNLTRFQEYGDEVSLDGAQATCLRTDKAWTPEIERAELRVRFPRSVFERDEEDRFRGIRFSDRPRAPAFQ
ncbi:MAG: hypothetical protein AAFR44_14835 [Pseudomonadota bacterium]